MNAGSRYCTPETSGIGHFLESCAVEGTMNINPNRFAENLARTGSGCLVFEFIFCFILRDQIHSVLLIDGYTSSHDTHSQIRKN